MTFDEAYQNASTLFFFTSELCFKLPHEVLSSNGSVVFQFPTLVFLSSWANKWIPMNVASGTLLRIVTIKK